MNFFEKLFGGKAPKDEPRQPAVRQPIPDAPSPHADPALDPNMIKVFDKYGREFFITKEEWRSSVLPGTIQSSWDNPDQLYGLIVNSLNDGFRSDVVDAARHLYAIDSDPLRAACIWGIVLMEEGCLIEAEKIFLEFIAEHGEAGVILTNLAKVHSERNDNERAEQILWRALEADPNQDNGFAWYESIHRFRGGDEAGLAALRRVAALPRSWRAQLWLARAELQSGCLDGAVALYRESFDHVAKPIPADLLMQISGDLGNSDHLPEILQLVGPHFDARQHGLMVGNNLIKAHIDLGQLDAAHHLVDQLYALNRPDWKESLGYWDTEIAKKRLFASSDEPQAAIRMSMFTVSGPVWLKPKSPAARLFPSKSADSVVVAFLGGSARIATNSHRVQKRLADAPGRMSRAIPLFLAEQVEFGTLGRTITLVPWITEPHAGFVVSRVAWNDEDAAEYSRKGDLTSDYVVISHLNADSDIWTAELRLVRSIDGHCLNQLSESFAADDATIALHRLAQHLLQQLDGSAAIELQPRSALYVLPSAANFPQYLLRLEQLLAVRCSGQDGVQSGFLSGERDIIDGNLQLCLAAPCSVSTRILLGETLSAMKRVRPDILPEFKERLALLQTEHPLTQPAQEVIQRRITEIFAT